MPQVKWKEEAYFQSPSLQTQYNDSVTCVYDIFFENLIASRNVGFFVMCKTGCSFRPCNFHFDQHR